MVSELLEVLIPVIVVPAGIPVPVMVSPTNRFSLLVKPVIVELPELTFPE